MVLSFWFGSFKTIMAHSWAFLALHSLSLWCCLFFFFSSWGWGWAVMGNCPINFKWHYRKTTVMGCAVLAVEIECCLTISPWSSSAIRSAHRLGWRQGWLFCFVHFPFFFPFSGGITLLMQFFMNILYEYFKPFSWWKNFIFMQLYNFIFSARKSVMYEINQSHLFENKYFGLYKKQCSTP